MTHQVHWVYVPKELADDMAASLMVSIDVALKLEILASMMWKPFPRWPSYHRVLQWSVCCNYGHR